jgi:hypothetical protein
MHRSNGDDLKKNRYNKAFKLFASLTRTRQAAPLN